MRRSIFLTTALFFAIEAAAGGSGTGSGQPIGAWPAPYGALPPAIVYDAFGRCLSPPHCPDQEQMKRFLERYERNYGQRLMVDRTGVDLAPSRRDVPPTPAAHIQPAYRDASQVRPEFEHVGEPLAAPRAIPRVRAKSARPGGTQPAAGESGKGSKRLAGVERTQGPHSERRARSIDRPAAGQRVAGKTAAPRAAVRQSRSPRRAGRE